MGGLFVCYLGSMRWLGASGGLSALVETAQQAHVGGEEIAANISVHSRLVRWIRSRTQIYST